MTKKKKIAVLYHNKCDDGFGAAWVLWKKFKEKAEYIGVTHDNPPPKGLRRKDVYIVDFSYKKSVLLQLLSIAKSLTIIDHHISAKEAVESVPQHLFDNTFSQSGAVLAWQYFFPKKPVPKLLQYIEDEDLWRWKLPHSKELKASLRVHDFDFKKWNVIANDWEKKSRMKKYIEAGKAILRYQEKRVAIAVEEAEMVEFCGYKTLASNSFNLVSEIGYAIYMKMPPIAIVWSQRKDKIIVSLRSNGTVDVSRLAAKFGGGGHKTAAAFRLESGKKLPWKAIK